MTSWSPQRRIALAAMLGLASLGATATPASALPLIGVGANVGVGVHIPSSGPLASDVTADLAVMGPVIGLQWWRTFDGAGTYLQGGVRWNVSPVRDSRMARPISSAMALAAFLGTALPMRSRCALSDVPSIWKGTPSVSASA